MQTQSELLAKAYDHLTSAQQYLDIYYIRKRGPSWQYSCHESALLEDILDTVRSWQETAKDASEKIA